MKEKIEVSHLKNRYKEILDNKINFELTNKTINEEFVNAIQLLMIFIRKKNEFGIINLRYHTLLNLTFIILQATL